jgi:hypothetical protein
MSRNPYGDERGLLSRLINGVQFINGSHDVDGANKAMAEACAEIITLIGKVDTLRRSLDALGLFIADAGYKWTPAMRQAYEQAFHIKGVREDE